MLYRGIIANCLDNQTKHAYTLWGKMLSHEIWGPSPVQAVQENFFLHCLDWTYYEHSK
jgi:hypothetical protein